MRKVEKQMNFALSNKGNWGNGNTSVFFHPDENVSEVRLHGNLIAWYDHNKWSLGISSCGYETVTTKSRLNALLQETFSDNKIVQKDFTWYVQNDYGDKIDFYDGQIISKDGASSRESHPNPANW